MRAWYTSGTVKNKILTLFALVCIVIMGIFFYVRSPYAARGGEAEEYIRTGIRACAPNETFAWRGECLSRLSKEVISKYSIQRTLVALSHIDEDQGIKGQCHVFAHYIGHAAYESVFGDLQKSLALCSVASACRSGCSHGVIEESVVSLGHTPSLPELSRLCSKERAGSEYNYYTCTHGLGHAFMLLTSNSVSRSLISCDSLHGLREQSECYLGVFMEQQFGSIGQGTTTDGVQEQKQIVRTCNAMKSRYVAMCYNAAVSRMIVRHNASIPSMTSFCASLDDTYRAGCYGTIGASVAAGFTDDSLVAQACMNVPSGVDRKYCIGYALRYAVSNIQEAPAVLSNICASAHFSPTDRSFCEKQKESVLQALSPRSASSIEKP